MKSKHHLSCTLAAAFLAGFTTLHADEPVSLDAPREHGSIERLDPALDDLLGAAAEGDLAQVDRLYRRCLDMGQSPHGILRMLLRHLQRLHLAAARMAEGARADDAMRALRPPVFSRQQDRFRRQLGQWRAPRLAAALQRVVDTEVACRTTGAPVEALAGRCLMQIAQAARHGLARIGVDAAQIDWTKLDAGQRLAALLMLREYDIPSGTEHLGRLLADPDTDVRFAAIQWVGEERLKGFR